MCVDQTKSLRGLLFLCLSIFLWPIFAVEAQLHQFSAAKTTQDYTKSLQWTGSGLKIDVELHQLEQKTLSDQIKKLMPAPFDTQAYSAIELKGLPLSTKAGLAQLPYLSFLIEGKVEELKFFQTIHQETKIKGLMPVPAALMPCRCADEKVQWHLDTQNYFTAGQQLVEWESLGDFRGREIVRVTIRPLQVDADGLKVVHDFSLEIEGAKGPFDWREVWEQTQQKNLALIGHANMFKTLGRYIAQKEAQGFRVHRLLYNNESAVELTRKIAALHQRYPLDYAMIIGSEDRVPTHYVETSADWNTPSDRPYFSFGGPSDRVPDVLYARIVADTPIELANQLKKFEEYEKRQYIDASGLNSSMVVASDEGFSPTDFEYAEKMLAPLQRELGWTPSYLFQGNENATAQNIIKRLNQGVEWFDYIGHGEGDRWPSVTGAALTTEHFKAIKSQVVKPIVIDVACQNGRMTRDKRIGVELMNLTQGRAPAGAVAYYGGSVDITWHPPAAMAVHISELRAQRRHESLGELIFAAQMRLLETFDDIVAASENLDWYHLQGDPMMLLQD